MHSSSDAFVHLDPWLLQSSVWKRVEDLAQGRTALAPLAVELHLGTQCNLACPQCVSRPTLDTGRFEPQRARELAAELVATGVKGVVLSGGGEPLLHPAADEVMRTLHEGGIAVALVTNGTLLHEHEAAVVAHAARIRVSLDASTPQTYGRFRPHKGTGGGLGRLQQNLETLAPHVRGRLSCSFVVFTRAGRGGEVDSNAGELAEAARRARELGCAAFEVNVGLDAGLQPDLLHSRVSSILAEQLPQLMQLSKQDFPVFVDPAVAHLAATGSIAVPPGRTYARCPAAQLRALITPAGVFLCPRHQGLASARFGDARTTALSTIWQSEARREALERVDPRVDCAGGCMSMELNDKLLEAIGLARRGARPAGLRPDEDIFL